MPKKLKAARVPAPYLHKPTGHDAVVLRDPVGKRRTVYLGQHGSPEAQRRCRGVLADYFAGKPLTTMRSQSAPTTSEWSTVAMLTAAYLMHAERFYRDADGKQTGEVTHATIAFELLLRLLRDTPTDRVRIADLLGVRQALVDLREQRKRGVRRRMA